MKAMKQRQGFTLIEVIVILAVLAILVGVAVPVAMKIFERTAEDATREEMDNIKKAILGDLRKLQSSFRSDFGFLGDIGCLPTTLGQLLTQGALPPWSPPASPQQVGAGWKGPYITGVPGEEFDKDQWGNAYTYTPVAGLCPLTATLTSSGASTSLTSDDITLSILANETTATTVRGAVKDSAGFGVQGVSVELYSPVNGVLTTTPINTDANGEYSFTSVPFGPRAVRALPPARFFLVPGSAVAETFGGDAGRNVVFQIVNYSATAITITTITASWNPSADRYDDIEINQINVDDSAPPPNNNFDSAELVDITDTAISANPLPSSSVRVFVDSADAQLPDIKLGTGSTARIELQFEGGDDMRNRDFTVTFAHTGGPSTVQFRP